ncbi:MAG: hypothetical protein ACK502_04945 [Alphaproteobacteria bacterium]
MLHKHALPFLITLLSLSFGSAVWLAFRAPIFVDDAHWLIQNSRALYDNLHIINLYPQCISNFAQSVPWPLLPGRIFASLFHPETLIGIRYFGLIKYLLCVVLVASAIWLLFEKRPAFWLILCAVVVLLSLGSLPLIMTMNRPESSILIGMCLMLLIPLMSVRLATPSGLIYAISIYLCVLSWLFSTHPKVQILIPAALLATSMFSIQDQRRRILLLVAVGSICISSVMLWKNHSTCPDYTMIETRLSWHSVLPQDITNKPDAAIRQIAQNIKETYTHFAPAIQTTKRYIGFFTVTGTTAIYQNAYTAINAINVILFLCVLILLGISIVTRLRWHHRNSNWKHTSWLMLALAIMLPAMLVILTLKHSHAKEGGMIIGTLLLACSLCIWLNGWHIKYAGVVRHTFMVLIPLGILNHALFFDQWNTLFQHTANPTLTKHGYFEADNRFQTIFDSVERNQAIIKAATACNINASNAKHLVVDDYTYMPFYKTFQPFYGRTLFLWGVPNKDYIGFLYKTGSDGVVTLCSSLPKRLKPLALENNGICCISKQRLQQPLIHNTH